MANDSSSTGKQPPKPAQTGKGPGGPSKLGLALLAAAVAVIVGLSVVYYRASTQDPVTDAADKQEQPEVTVAELMQTGPLEDLVLGSKDAPNTIVEYASMTCPHCALFQKDVFPEVKKKYIDTGKAKYIMREFPLDQLAVAAFMLARCSGPDRYYPMIDALFETQEVWAVEGNEGPEKLAQVARQANISQEQFDKCLADKNLFDKIVAVRTKANDKYGVNSTPTFFVNGKRLGAEHSLVQFDEALGGASDKPADTPAANSETPPQSPNSETPPQTPETPPQNP